MKRMILGLALAVAAPSFAYAGEAAEAPAKEAAKDAPVKKIKKVKAKDKKEGDVKVEAPKAEGGKEAAEPAKLKKAGGNRMERGGDD